MNWELSNEAKFFPRSVLLPGLSIPALERPTESFCPKTIRFRNSKVKHFTFSVPVKIVFLCQIVFLCLHCRGIRIPVVGSAVVTERMAAIADYVCSKDYDIVVFQEVSDPFAMLTQYIVGHIES